MYENRVLRRIFGHKREEVAGGRRSLHKELYNLYSSSSIGVIRSRRTRWTEHVARTGAKRNEHRILIG
jgi:hypothetical protein